ncbi:MAG: type II toxin-antitoxin system PemK/MazF family toxin [Cyanobacteriota bacterium]|nr:type II toxin-antitoxin system PemK/MazF family toxin [Cyanobacteriota bacterium]
MHQSEVWLAIFEPTIGAEIGKTRPAVIVSSERIGILPLAVIVPITNWQERYEARNWMVRIEPTTENGLRKVSAADTFQVRSVSTQRLIRKLGILPDATMQDIAVALSVVLNLD